MCDYMCIICILYSDNVHFMFVLLNGLMCGICYLMCVCVCEILVHTMFMFVCKIYWRICVKCISILVNTCV